MMIYKALYTYLPRMTIRQILLKKPKYSHFLHILLCKIRYISVVLQKIVSHQIFSYIFNRKHVEIHIFFAISHANIDGKMSKNSDFNRK